MFLEQASRAIKQGRNGGIGGRRYLVLKETFTCQKKGVRIEDVALRAGVRNTAVPGVWQRGVNPFTEGSTDLEGRGKSLTEKKGEKGGIRRFVMAPETGGGGREGGVSYTLG